MTKYLIDLSAWARRDLPDVKERWHQFNFAGELVCHPLFAIETLHGCVNRAEFRKISDGLRRHFEWAHPDAVTAELALDLQRQMSEAGPTGQRVKGVDLLTAALAEQKGYGVLHYDSDYDAILDRSSATFASEWIVERGSLEAGGNPRSHTRELRKRYRDGLQARLMQLSERQEFELWPELIELVDGHLGRHGLKLPPPVLPVD